MAFFSFFLKPKHEGQEDYLFFLIEGCGSFTGFTLIGSTAN